MTSIHKSKGDIEPDGLYKLLSQTDTQIIKSNLSTKSTTQKEKKMRMKTEKEEEFPTNNQEHLERK